jgi:hypothetical protein
MNERYRAGFRSKKAGRGAALLLVVLLAQVLVACTDTPPDPSREGILRALDRSLSWLTAHPSDPDGAQIGELTLDAWPWTIYSRLHPDPEIRARSAEEARSRLQGLEPRVEPTLVSLSYWALLLRNIESHNLDTAAYREALSRMDIEAILATGNPTTNLWITELLRYSGIPGKSRVKETYLVTNAAAGIARFKPTVRGAYALYHEIAPATDLGRKPIRVFSNDQVEFARRVLSALLEVSRNAGDTDAVAEVLITASLLGERERRYYGDGIEWLLTQQREDGTYHDARTRNARLPSSHFRHGILVVSWALLESLQ